MKTKLLCLGLVIFIAFSCKKTDTPTDSGSSQLWIKVDQTIPDFKITLKLQDNKNSMIDYIVSYSDKTFNPNLKSITVADKNTTDTWILVYRDFDRTDEITLQLINGKEYKTKGFEYKEKRLIEILHNTSGTVNVVDRDISIIEKFIYVE